MPIPDEFIDRPKHYENNAFDRFYDFMKTAFMFYGLRFYDKPFFWDLYRWSKAQAQTTKFGIILEMIVLICWLVMLYVPYMRDTLQQQSKANELGSK